MNRQYASSAVFRELLDVLRDADELFLDGPRAVRDETRSSRDIAGSPKCSRWRSIVTSGPTRRAGVRRDRVADPQVRRRQRRRLLLLRAARSARTYRIRGRKGDAVYLSICVYGGPTDGRWSNRIVSLDQRPQDAFGADGTFEIASVERRARRQLARARARRGLLVTRDYLVEPASGRKATWRDRGARAGPPPAAARRRGDRARLRCTANFIRDLLNICPIPTAGGANSLLDPYRAAGDDLRLGGAGRGLLHGPLRARRRRGAGHRGPLARMRVLEPLPVEPVPADLRLSLPARQRSTAARSRYEPDGSWRIVVAARDPGHAELALDGRTPARRAWFRWFLAEALPERPRTRVIEIGTR